MPNETTEFHIPGTGRPMSEAPKDRSIIARGHSVKRGGNFPEYIEGDEIIARVHYRPAVAIDYGSFLGER